jgi:hypothetical protein
MVVLALLALFTIVGLTFVLYANSAADGARINKEGETQTRPDIDPEFLLAFFLGQLLYDVDDQTGIESALRGHSLARLIYGSNDEGQNVTPFNGIGRAHTGTGTFANPFGLDDFNLINYTYFPADGFLRDPERVGSRKDPTRPRGPYVGGFNPPYTYPDLNNMFLAAVKADGTVLVPSFHRPWTGFGPLDPANPNWFDAKKAWLKYQVLRPRPADMGPGFPAPADPGGDVKNLIGGPGGNDSVWLDLDAPVMTAPDGRKYKPLFAPLIVDLDGRVNVNVHGNVRGPGGTHVSNQGWGPWEVNLGRVLTSPSSECTNLLTGSARAFGRYGPGRQPGTPGQVATPFAAAPFYSRMDYDACQEQAGFAPTAAMRLPGGDPR